MFGVYFFVFISVFLVSGNTISAGSAVSMCQTTMGDLQSSSLSAQVVLSLFLRIIVTDVESRKFLLVFEFPNVFVCMCFLQCKF